MRARRYRVGFVDHSFHQKTRSTEFLIELLRGSAEVEVLWDHSWDGGQGVSAEELNEREFDALVFFQMLYPAKWLRQLGCRNITLVPMYDAAAGCSDEEWLEYRDCKMLNFSREIERRHARLGLSSMCCQYFSEPEAGPPSFDGLRGFFWQRTEDVTWEHVRRLIEGTRFESFHLHLAVDPGGYRVVEPSDEEQRSCRFTVSGWSEGGADYRALRQRANVFFAPRKTEGIGKAFLEALGAGMLVVAPNAPTMNEYIVNGSNGLLFEPRDPKPLSFVDAEEMGGRARCLSTASFAKWTREASGIPGFVMAPRRRRDVTLGMRLLVEARRMTCRFGPRWRSLCGPLANGFRRPFMDIPRRAFRAMGRRLPAGADADRRPVGDGRRGPFGDGESK